MSDHQQRFNRQSIRLKEYDYTQQGLYFVTICTIERLMMFGDVRGGKMELNFCGEIVRDEWLKTPVVRKYVELDEFVVMPNHFHGILKITVGATRRVAPTTENSRGPIRGSIGAIVGQFKSAVTKRINELNQSRRFIWQRNYYEHVIRDENDLNRIRQYISDNPMNWETDRNNIENLYM